MKRRTFFAGAIASAFAPATFTAASPAVLHFEPGTYRVPGGFHFGPVSRPLLVNGHGAIFEVSDFGAVGDGLHDDGPAITAAIAALMKHGGELHFRSVFYRQSTMGAHQAAPATPGGESVPLVERPPSREPAARAALV